MSTKKAILVVSFGTSYHETREKNIDKIEESIQNAFPDIPVRRAWTSGMIMKKLKTRDNIHIDNTQEALEKLLAEGFDDITIQPTHIINGSEFDKVINSASHFRGKFKRLAIGRPLLNSVEDYHEVIHILDREYDFKSKEAVVFMGHGSEHNGNAAYPALDYMLKDKGFDSVHIATVEGYPPLDNAIRSMETKNVNKIHLLPLMTVAGDHILEDMAGDDEDSWRMILEGRGYQTQAIIKGLGEIKGIRDIFVSHAAKAMEGQEILI
ncbi:MAG: sirohydrochlorin cobaltochelatase [Eubacteriaceae bacterium]|nr:sirohydrochlorin cobaltochelatase [Eubacteriaceae bacterium]